MARGVKQTFSRTVVERVNCPRCATLYEYDRVLTTEREVVPGEEAAAVGAAETDLDRQQAQSAMAVVRCPGCRKFAPGSLANRLTLTGVCLGGAVICALATMGLIFLADATGRFFWVLALLAALGVPVCLLFALVALLKPTTHKTRLAGTGA